MADLTAGLPTKSAKIRALAAAGYKRAQIADFLGVRYQQVRNVLVAAEPPHAAEARPDKSGQGIRNRLKLTLGPGGRIVIPAPLREALGIEEGDTLLAWMENDEVRLTTPRLAMREAQELIRNLIGDSGNLADELIAERRREAGAETGNG
jgi:AbrB family looped-hinge helix DNA binding protein